MNRTYTNVTECTAVKLFINQCKLAGKRVKDFSIRTVNYNKRNHTGTFRLNTK